MTKYHGVIVKQLRNNSYDWNVFDNIDINVISYKTIKTKSQPNLNIIKINYTKASQ